MFNRSIAYTKCLFDIYTRCIAMIFRSQRWNSTVHEYICVCFGRTKWMNKRIGIKRTDRFELLTMNEHSEATHNNFTSTNWFALRLFWLSFGLPHLLWLSSLSGNLSVLFLTLWSREWVSFWVVFVCLSCVGFVWREKRKREPWCIHWSVELFHISLTLWVFSIPFGAYQSTSYQPICCLDITLLWQSKLWINNCLAHSNHTEPSLSVLNRALWR